jgi:hypothetical protein
METQKAIKFSEYEKTILDRCRIVTTSTIKDRKKQEIEEDDSKTINMIARENIIIPKDKLLKALKIIEKNISRFEILSSWDYWDKATEEAKGLIAPSKGNRNPRQDLIEAKVEEAKFIIEDLVEAKIILLKAFSKIIN